MNPFQNSEPQKRETRVINFTPQNFPRTANLFKQFVGAISDECRAQASKQKLDPTMFGVMCSSLLNARAHEMLQLAKDFDDEVNTLAKQHNIKLEVHDYHTPQQTGRPILEELPSDLKLFDVFKASEGVLECYRADPDTREGSVRSLQTALENLRESVSRAKGEE